MFPSSALSVDRQIWPADHDTTCSASDSHCDLFCWSLGADHRYPCEASELSSVLATQRHTATAGQAYMKPQAALITIGRQPFSRSQAERGVHSVLNSDGESLLSQLACSQWLHLFALTNGSASVLFEIALGCGLRLQGRFDTNSGHGGHKSLHHNIVDS